MEPGQQQYTHRQNTYWNPELHVGQNCFEHLEPTYWHRSYTVKKKAGSDGEQHGKNPYTASASFRASGLIASVLQGQLV